mgnify:CR=1 FL=1
MYFIIRVYVIGSGKICLVPFVEKRYKYISTQLYNICGGNQDSGNPENPSTEANASLYVEPNFRKKDGERKDGERKDGDVRKRYYWVDEASFLGSTYHRWVDE